MYKVVKILTGSTTPGLPHNGVHQWCTVQTMCSDRIPCCWERVSDKSPQMPLKRLWKCCVQQKHCWLLG